MSSDTLRAISCMIVKFIMWGFQILCNGSIAPDLLNLIYWDLSEKHEYPSCNLDLDIDMDATVKTENDRYYDSHMISMQHLASEKCQEVWELELKVHEQLLVRGDEKKL